MLLTKLVNDLQCDIIKIIEDADVNTEMKHKNYNELLELSYYIIDVLKNIYNKKILNLEIIIQYCYFYFKDKVLDNIYPFDVNPAIHRNIFNHLIKENENCPPQKSMEWYKYRYQRITASDIASIFDKSPFTSKKELLRNKCQALTHSNFNSNKYTDHGNKYEICATWFYQYLTKSECIEFGCLPHPHIGFLGASPDGITKDGIMLEIKCPLSRIILGIPPIYYWYQIQIQLEVANLSRCDYIECNFKEKPKEEFYQIIQEKKIEKSIEVGFIIEYIDDLEKKTKFEYFPYETNISEFKQWETSFIEKLLVNNNTYVKTIYWILEEYGLCEIYRDIRWYHSHLSNISEFWDEVIFLRNNPELIQKPVVKEKKKKDNECLINDSDDDL